MSVRQLVEKIAIPTDLFGPSIESSMRIVTEYLRFPDEYWELLDLYGMGSFYGELSLLDPRDPEFFCDQLTSAVAELALGILIGDVESVDSAADWLPVIDSTIEWGGYVERADPNAQVLMFLCQGGPGDFRFEGSLSQFLSGYASETVQAGVFENEIYPLPLEFLPAERFWSSAERLQFDWSRTTYEPGQTVNGSLDFVGEMYPRLRSLWIES